MPAPKGHPPYNVNGEGGAPFLYDPEKEAEDLDAWSKTTDATSIMQFLFHKDYCYDTYMRMIKRSERLAKAHKKAYERCAINREHKLNNKEMNYGVWERYADYYDRSLRDHEQSKLKYQSDLKVEQNKAFTPDQEAMINSVFARTEEARKEYNQSSDSSTLDSNINTESKS